MRRNLLFFAVFPVLLAGCATFKGINTNHELRIEKTGLFDTADEAIEKSKNLLLGATRCPEDLASAGFNPDAPNVMNLPGAKGSRYILGTDNPQVTISDPKQIQEIAHEWNRYHVTVYPIRTPKVYKQAIYLNKQDLLTTGTDGEYFIICRDKVVAYYDFTGQKALHKSGENKRFGGNVGEFFIGMLGNPLSGLGF